MSEWISIKDAARLLEVSVSTVRRSLVDPGAPERTDRADANWGPGNWRRIPFSGRGDLQVKRKAAEAKARGEKPIDGEAGPTP